MPPPRARRRAHPIKQARAHPGARGKPTDRGHSPAATPPGDSRAGRIRCYEDFRVGDVFEHRPGRTISEADNTWFTLLTMNTHPLHFDAAYAARTEFGRPVVNSCLTLAIVVGMSVADVSQGAIANLGWRNIELTAPVFAGDTLYAESEVIARRASASRPSQGIVTVRTRGLKADGTPFMTFERSVLVPRRRSTGSGGEPGRALRTVRATAASTVRARKARRTRGGAL